MVSFLKSWLVGIGNRQQKAYHEMLVIHLPEIDGMFDPNLIDKAETMSQSQILHAHVFDIYLHFASIYGKK